jgi:hypothetical protein
MRRQMGIGEHERPGRGATDVWLTPLDLVRSLGTFDLDPCGQEGHDTAHEIYCPPLDGLSLDWHGRVFLNPPYSQVGVWLDKLHTHGLGIALVFARTDTRWAQKFMPLADSVFFPSKRIRFLSGDGKPGKWTAGAPSMLLAFGERPMWRHIMPGWEA